VGLTLQLLGKNSKANAAFVEKLVNPACLRLAFSTQWLVKWCFTITVNPLFPKPRNQHSLVLLICLEFCRLAHNYIKHYQTQPLTYVLCLVLIFLSPTFKNWSCSSGRGSRHSLDQKASSVLAWRTISMFLVLPFRRTPFTSSVCQPFYILDYSLSMSPPDKKSSFLQIKIYII